jgi:hypothetical protein
MSKYFKKAMLFVTIFGEQRKVMACNIYFVIILCSTASRPALCWEVKRQGHEAHPSLPLSVETNNRGATSPFPHTSLLHCG